MDDKKIQLNYKLPEDCKNKYYVVPSDAYFCTDRIAKQAMLCEEHEIIKKIKKNKEGYFDFRKTLIDVGAEDGNYSMLLDFKENYCFEPNKHMCCLIYTNMYMKNKVCNTHVYNCGCGDKEEDVVFNGFSEIGGGNYGDSMSRLLDKSYSTMHKMVIDDLKIKNVGLIKTDTEGFDLQVLKGSIQTIKDNNYPPILFECWKVGYLGMTQEKHDEIFDFLKKLGYTIFEYWGDDETHLAIHKTQIKKKKKYSIVTYNFGGYETIHEIKNPSSNCEYVYITDDINISSQTWNVVYVDKLPGETNFDAVCRIRYVDFWKYVTTDVVIKIDGSVSINGDTDELYNAFISSKSELGILIHPFHKTFSEEYAVWVDKRGYNKSHAKDNLNFIKNELQYDADKKRGLAQVNVVIEKNTKNTIALDVMTYGMLRMMNDEQVGLCERIDQINYSLCLQKFFKNIKCFYMDYSILTGKPFYWCSHGTNIPMEFGTTISENFFFDKKIEIQYNK